MSGHIVVGYTATPNGEDAVALGSRLAAASGSELDVVVVLPGDDRSVITPPDAGYDRYLRTQAAEWLGTAAEKIPDAVTYRTHVRYGDSFAEGLLTAATELGASHIVIGAANGGLRGRHRLGTVSMDPAYGSGSNIGGVGIVFILGMLIIVVGIVIMTWQAIKRPAFFRGETLSLDAPASVRRARR